MPYDDPDATDPLTLHGVEVETDNEEADREMAECFIEEFLRMGFDCDRLLKMFQTRGYAGPFIAYQALGEEKIVSLIDETIQRWGGRERTQAVDRNATGEIMLPVLEQ